MHRLFSAFAWLLASETGVLLRPHARWNSRSRPLDVIKQFARRAACYTRDMEDVASSFSNGRAQIARLETRRVRRRTA